MLGPAGSSLGLPQGRAWSQRVLPQSPHVQRRRVPPTCATLKPYRLRLPHVQRYRGAPSGAILEPVRPRPLVRSGAVSLSFGPGAGGRSSTDRGRIRPWIRGRCGHTGASIGVRCDGGAVPQRNGVAGCPAGEAENAAALGGLRNPNQALARSPGLRAVEPRVRRVAEDFGTRGANKDVTRKVYGKLGTSEAHGFPPTLVEDFRTLLQKEFQADARSDKVSRPRVTQMSK
jgi:hypothetical protein